MKVIFWNVLGGAVFLAGRLCASYSSAQVPGACELHQHRLVSRVARRSVIVR